MLQKMLHLPFQGIGNFSQLLQPVKDTGFAMRLAFSCSLFGHMVSDMVSCPGNNLQRTIQHCPHAFGDSPENRPYSLSVFLAAFTLWPAIAPQCKAGCAAQWAGDAFKNAATTYGLNRCPGMKARTPAQGWAPTRW